ncbi:MAG: DUF1573 domain-containing protein [Bacteroidia bacterium]|nr:DUF1573 domain-containing protein [Bacteroidia bacterium]
MKKIIYVVTISTALLMGNVLLAQDAKTSNSTTEQPASLADIKFDKTTHDFGTIPQGGNGECEFTFTNTGKEPLVITNCMGSCGCTVPQCPKEPVLPGKKGVIKVKYDTNRVGPFVKSVTVNSNAKSGVVTLQIKGTVEAKPVEEAFPQNKNEGAPRVN